MRTLLVVFPIAFSGAVVAQTPPTLAEYLKAHPEELGLAVGAEGVRAGAGGPGLALYGRKLARLGGVTAVVPQTMVRFEEYPTKPPNLYDGLPRNAKILYLLSTLSAGQWGTAAGQGIGISDLRGEQRDVFLSLLPNHPSWDLIRVSADRGWGPILGHGALDAKDRPAMRLRIEQDLEFDLRLQGEQESYTGASPSGELGKPGETVRRRSTQEEDNAGESYGVEIRSVVPNALKKGQLDTSTLNGTVALPPQSTVGEALAKIGAATGREILADARVRGLSVSWPGGPARAGDLLDAFALSVGGIYRKVDGRYLLVADVVGAGTRKLRYMLWKGAIDAEVERRKMEWVGGLGKSGLALATGFPDDPTSKPTPGIKKRLDATERSLFSLDWFSTDELSPEQRAFVDREIARHKTQSIVPGKVAVSSSLKYRFILPDGNALQSEGNLGPMENFTPRAPRLPMGADPAVPLAVNPDGAIRPLILRPGTLDEARKAIAVARAYGFTELWAETDRPEILAEVIKGGLPTRLFARPWASTTQGDSDRTILGDSGRIVTAGQSTNPLWTRLTSEIKMQGYPRLRPRLADGDLLSPFDPAWPGRRNAIAALARTPGLSGVVVADAQPHGYEPELRDSTVGGYVRSLVEAWAFGYDERTRLAFFRQAGYDPVDLTTEALDFDVEMDTPSFPRYPARPSAYVREAYQAWSTFRATANARALKELRDALGDLAVLGEVRRTFEWQPPRGDQTLAPWMKGEAPPTYEDQFVPDLPGAIPFVTAPEPRMKEALAEFATSMRILAPMAKSPRAFDLTHIPSWQWEETLAKGLKRK